MIIVNILTQLRSGFAEAPMLPGISYVLSWVCLTDVSETMPLYLQDIISRASIARMSWCFVSVYTLSAPPWVGPLEVY